MREQDGACIESQGHTIIPETSTQEGEVTPFGNPLQDGPTIPKIIKDRCQGEASNLILGGKRGNRKLDGITLRVNRGSCGRPGREWTNCFLGLKCDRLRKEEVVSLPLFGYGPGGRNEQGQTRHQDHQVKDLKSESRPHGHSS